MMQKRGRSGTGQVVALVVGLVAISCAAGEAAPAGSTKWDLSSNSGSGGGSSSSNGGSSSGSSDDGGMQYGGSSSSGGTDDSGPGASSSGGDDAGGCSQATCSTGCCDSTNTCQGGVGSDGVRLGWRSLHRVLVGSDVRRGCVFGGQRVLEWVVVVVRGGWLQSADVRRLRYRQPVLHQRGSVRLHIARILPLVCNRAFVT